jgi:hypothetical protein
VVTPPSSSRLDVLLSAIDPPPSSASPSPTPPSSSEPPLRASAVSVPLSSNTDRAIPAFTPVPQYLQPAQQAHGVFSVPALPVRRALSMLSSNQLAQRSQLRPAPVTACGAESRSLLRSQSTPNSASVLPTTPVPPCSPVSPVSPASPSHVRILPPQRRSPNLDSYTTLSAAEVARRKAALQVRRWVSTDLASRTCSTPLSQDWHRNGTFAVRRRD